MRKEWAQVMEPSRTSVQRGSNQRVGERLGSLTVGEKLGTLVDGDDVGYGEGALVLCLNQPSSSSGLQGQRRSDPPASSTASQMLTTGRDSSQRPES